MKALAIETLYTYKCQILKILVKNGLKTGLRVLSITPSDVQYTIILISQ